MQTEYSLILYMRRRTHNVFTAQYNVDDKSYNRITRFIINTRPNGSTGIYCAYIHI